MNFGLSKPKIHDVQRYNFILIPILIMIHVYHEGYHHKVCYISFKTYA